MTSCTYNVNPRDEEPIYCGDEPVVVKLWKITDNDDAPPRATLCWDHWNKRHGALEAGGWLKDWYWEDVK